MKAAAIVTGATADDDPERESLPERIARYAGPTPHDHAIFYGSMAVRGVLLVMTICHLMGMHIAGYAETIRIAGVLCSGVFGGVKLIQFGDEMFTDRKHALKALGASLIWFACGAWAYFM